MSAPHQLLPRVAVLAILAGFVASCGRGGGSDVKLTGPAYVLTTDGADDYVREVLQQVLQSHMKPVRLSLDEGEAAQLGTIHADMRVHTIKFQTSDRKEKVDIPTNLRATVTVHTFDGSSNWDGEHQIGFETDPPGSFRDGDKMRRRFARKLLEVAVKQLPDRGAFKTDAVSSPSK